MSYILDALRKSDQQRQRGTAPTLLTTQAAAMEAKRPAWLLYGFLAVALLGAGVVIGWLQAWQQAPLAPAVAPVASKSPEQAKRSIAPAPFPVLPEMARKEEPLVPPQQPKPAPITPVTQSPVDAVPAVPEQAIRTAPVEAVALPGGERDKVVTLAELPSSIQQELPAMQVSLHAYSGKPRASLVSINNQLLKDGDTLAPGLKLEQITPDGMIFSFKGYRFRRGVR